VFFDFGTSFADGKKVTEKIADAVPVTLTINLLALFLAMLIGIPLGVLGAVKEKSFWDRASGALSLFFISMPSFWIALMLLSWLGVYWRVLPISGLHSLFYEEMSLFKQILDTAWHLLLPVFVTSLSGMAAVSRYMRSSMLEVLKQNYIRTARAKGLPERLVLYRHALKNALLPVLTLLGLAIPGLLGGSVVIESIFSIPGMGRLFFSSVFARDYPVLMGLLTLGAILTLIGNALADAAYAWADPRIHHEHH
jgi:peptide/nickel transport system permease protein